MRSFQIVFASVLVASVLSAPAFRLQARQLVKANVKNIEVGENGSIARVPEVDAKVFNPDGSIAKVRVPEVNALDGTVTVEGTKVDVGKPGEAFADVKVDRVKVGKNGEVANVEGVHAQVLTPEGEIVTAEVPVVQVGQDGSVANVEDINVRA